MANDPESDVLAGIAAIGGAGWVEETNLFRGPEDFIGRGVSGGRKVPAEAVFVRIVSAPPAVRYASAFGSGQHTVECTVQILLRTQPGQYNTGRTKAQAIWDAIQDNISLISSGGSMLRGLNSFPIPAGRSERGSYYFSMLFRYVALETAPR